MTLSFDLVPTEKFLKAHRLLKCALKLVLYCNSRAKFLCVNSLKSNMENNVFNDGIGV